MTLKTWKAEFFDEKFLKQNFWLVSDEACVLHSLKKWRGLTPENLAKHGLELHVAKVSDPSSDEWLVVDADTCALCHKYQEGDNCGGCPLADYLQYRCDHVDYFKGNYAPYAHFTKTGSPDKMIAALEQTLEIVKKEDI